MTDGGPALRVVAAVAAGGAVGALARWGLTETFPSSTDAFPWTTFAVNVTGALALALLPALAAVRRSRTLAAGLGPGLLGGYTTLSAYSEQTRALLDHGETVTAGCYVLGTLAACLLVVALASRLVPPEPPGAVE